jgi:hypothetical protein
VPLFRRKKDSRLHAIGEAEAYGRSYGQHTGDVRVLKPKPERRTPRRQLKITGEALRNAFLERLNKRASHDKPHGPDG